MVSCRLFSFIYAFNAGSNAMHKREKERPWKRDLDVVTIYGVILCDVHLGLCVKDCVMTGKKNPAITL